MPQGGILPQALEDLIRGYREGKPMFGASPTPTATPKMIPTPADEYIEDEDYPTPSPETALTPLSGIQKPNPLVEETIRTPKPVLPSYRIPPTKKPKLNPRPHPRPRPTMEEQMKLRQKIMGE